MPAVAKANITLFLLHTG